jgi:hypothetical protein
MLLTYEDKPQFADVPAGTYDVQLVGTEEAKPFDGPSRYGRANNGPRLLWRFRITAGERAGQDLVQFTGAEVVQKSGLLRLLTMLLGRPLRKGEQIDPDTMKGFRFRAAWAINPDSEAGRCHIASLSPISDLTPPANGAAPQATPPPPPPRKPLTPADVDGDFFWVVLEDGQPPVLRDRASIEARIKEHSLDPRLLMLCPKGKQTWETAASLGFADPVPY